ncbi:MAG: EAL domain-containing protein [Roseofilum sp. SBFL]|uniref:putative bifunctional diguanylate cyclase/phosphodiesterase n=1 Tax=unclassified Roseofilum TaxID=2620099 RepID=UPI001B22E1C7|nr:MULTISPECIES: EAL domain-containing protein [unclassified Roseofilum]MBP0012086.1 EAL domain-containing protein [Roseofilum sp. SID3]MBP0024595.1 EAL domain-containing protein [Roseofilum sp. SID2]MBP0039410.1 EAL domain-containing protein [Roseofilum sp. SID1]MBP0043414.1 EAL domain-containing protein [Roseofilum sp. SBFL]
MDKEHLKSTPPDFHPELSMDEAIMLLSHELRTPLTSIRGVVRLMQSGHVTPESAEGKYMLAMAIKNIGRLERLAQTIEQQPTLPLTLFKKEDLEKIQLELDLKQAIDKQELSLVYQPIVSLFPRKVMAFEALIRWHHGAKGLISPGVFIPVAEQTGLIHEIGQWVIRQSCSQLKRWKNRLPSDYSLLMNLNLSPLQLLHPQFSEQLKSLIQELQISPYEIRLEITETMLMENLEVATNTIQELRDFGFEFDIDDFGTGYSSLSRLKNLAVNGLKIDRFFLQEKQWNLIKAILLIASDVGLDVIAEGVETAEDFEQLKELGCQYFQGYFFSKPVDENLAIAWMENQLSCSMD